MKNLQILLLIPIVLIISNCAIIPLLLHENAKDVKQFMENDESQKQADSTEIQELLDDIEQAKKEALLEELHTPKTVIVAPYTDVLYIGLPNFLTIFTNGFPDSTLHIDCTNARLEKTGQYNYYIYPKEYGRVVVTVKGKGIKPTEFKFNANRMPSISQFGSFQYGDTISVAEFKKPIGLASFPDFKISANCKTVSFTVTRISADGTIQSIHQIGGRGKFQEQAKSLQEQATSGDIYLFENILCRCPGDRFDVKNDNLIFRIK